MSEGDELTMGDDEGAEPDDAALAELAAIEDADGAPEDGAAADELARLRGDLEAARGGLEAERAARRAAVARYREAMLAAEPALPPELVVGDSLDELDASAEAARRAVARIRERLAAEAEDAAARGFPAGAPARADGPAAEGLTPSEKIALGLERRER